MRTDGGSALQHLARNDIADQVGIEALLGRPGHLPVDARSPEMFSGADRAGAARDGRIPGAISLPARRETHGDGTFKAWRVPTVRDDGTFVLARRRIDRV